VESPLQEVISAGEQLKITPRIRRFFAGRPGCKLINHYGPSETHVVTAFELTGEPDKWPELPAIGRPIANTQAYVLDAEGQPAPVGVPGELYFGGDCLARGYLGRQDLTDERFVPNPFDADRSPRLYRTGDLARYLPDGTLLFLGRNDDQVKIRGYRVELGEIETTLAGHAGVDAVAVAVREETGFKRLVVYVVPAGDQPDLANQLWELARRSLPDYMLPDAYVFLDKLPLTRTGKVDRSPLPEADSTDRSLEESFIAPRDEMERGIAQVWEELLGVRPVGVGHDFFDLGGHSLLASRLVAHIDKKFGQRIGLVDFFQAPTIEGVAALLREPPPVTAPVRRKTVRPAAPRSPLLLVHPLPIFRPLARRLGPDQPVAFLNMPPVHQLPTDHAMDDLLEPMLEDVLREHSEPYCIGGWCRYGLIAYELACRLRARGKQVATVALLDVPSPEAMWAMRGWRARGTQYRIMRYELTYHLACLRQLRTTEAIAYLAKRAQLYLTYLKKKLVWDLTRGNADDGHAPSLREEFTPNLSGYVAGPYDGRVVLIKADKGHGYGSLDPSLGWNELTKSPVEIESVTGNHLSMLLEPDVELLASKLSRLLGRDDHCD
jgi:thioesterase domain-containing protein